MRFKKSITFLTLAIGLFTAVSFLQQKQLQSTTITFSGNEQTASSSTVIQRLLALGASEVHLQKEENGIFIICYHSDKSPSEIQEQLEQVLLLDIDRSIEGFTVETTYLSKDNSDQPIDLKGTLRVDTKSEICRYGYRNTTSGSVSSVSFDLISIGEKLNTKWSKPRNSNLLSTIKDLPETRAGPA